MGNKRGTLFIGTIVAAISIVLAVGAIIPAMQNDTSTVSTGLNPLGHVSLVIYDPDGNVVAYRQGDNFVTTTAVNAVGNLLFDGTAVTLGTFNFLGLCEGAPAAVATVQTANSCTSPLATDRIADGGNTPESLMGGVAGNYKRVLSNTFVIQVADAGKTVGELGIFDASTTGNMLALSSFATFVAQNGGNVVATYTVTITG